MAATPKADPMRAILHALLLFEVTLLVGGAGVMLFAEEQVRRPLQVEPVFRPYLDDAVIGDRVRYERLDAASGKPIGYVDYSVHLAVEFEGQNLGREFILEIRERDAGAGERTRRMRIRPRSNEHGFLPPLFAEEERGVVPGGTPVIRSIATARFRLREQGPETDGFLVEAVVPRRGVTAVAERYWMTPKVPVFGVARFEREGEVFTLLTMEFAKR